MNSINDLGLTHSELKKHLNNIINALIALCPTRNYISQFLMVLPEEYATMYDSFPEFLSDPQFRSQLQTILGLTIGPKIQYSSNSFAEKLVNIIEFTFKTFENQAWLQEWNEFLKEVRDDKVPNVVEEWVSVKIQLAIKDPIYGKLSFMILKQITENLLNNQKFDATGQLIEPNNLKLDDLVVKLQISKSQLEPTINNLVNKFKIIQTKKQKSNEGREYDILLLHDSIKVEWLNTLLQKNM